MVSDLRSEFAQQVKSATNLRDLFTEYGHDLRGTGHTLECLCPFHNEKSPSCKVHPEDGYFKCFGCGKSGDVFEFVMLADQCDFPAAVQKLADKAGLSEKPLTVQELAAFKHLPEAFLRTLGVKEFAGGVVIPYWTASKKAARARLRHSLRGKKRFTWGRRDFDGKALQIVPYGVWRGGSGAVLLIVEGETDCWAGWNYGEHVLGLPGAENVKCLELAHIEKYARLIVIQEPGDAGEKFVRNVARRAKAVGYIGSVSGTSLIDSKDLSDLHIKAPGKFCETLFDSLQKAVEVRVDVPSDYTVADEIADDISGKRRNIDFPDCPALSTSLAMLPGNILLLCGAAGASKTFATLEWAYKWFLFGEQVAVLELEKYGTFHYRRIMAMWAKAEWMMTPYQVKTRPDEARVVEVAFRPMYNEMRKAELVSTVPDGQDATGAWILAWMERMYDSGRKILIIDPISLMQQEGNRADDDQRNFIGRAKTLNEKHGGRLILVSHPTKDQGEAPPQEKYIAGAANFMRATDSVFWLQPHDREVSVFWPLDDSGIPFVDGPTPAQKPYNRTMWVLKKRNAYMHRTHIAMNFDRDSLSHMERGFIE